MADPAEAAGGAQQNQAVQETPNEAAAHAVDASLIRKIIRGFYRGVWIFLDNLLGTIVYLLTMIICYPLRFIWPTLYLEMDSFMFREMMRNVGYWLWSANYSIVEYGDLPFRYQNERCLVVVNHQSMLDVPVFMATTCKKGVGGGKVMWILDVMFKYVHFGWISWMRSDFFIQQGRETRDLQGPLLMEHTRRYYWDRDRRWFVVFPEGGFLYKRRETSQAYARKYGYAVLKHVTLPRVGAIKALLETTNPSGTNEPAQNGTNNGQEGLVGGSPQPGFRYLVDVTLAYPDGEPLSLWEMFLGCGPHREIGIYYKQINIANVPRDNDEKLTRYMYDLWEDKERLLGYFNVHGQFPGVPRDQGCTVDYHLAGLLLHNGLIAGLAVSYYFLFHWLIFYVSADVFFCASLKTTKRQILAYFAR